MRVSHHRYSKHLLANSLYHLYPPLLLDLLLIYFYASSSLHRAATAPPSILSLLGSAPSAMETWLHTQTMKWYLLSLWWWWDVSQTNVNGRWDWSNNALLLTLRREGWGDNGLNAKQWTDFKGHSWRDTFKGHFYGDTLKRDTLKRTLLNGLF
jgi:hypothetical protein